MLLAGQRNTPGVSSTCCVRAARVMNLAGLQATCIYMKLGTPRLAAWNAPFVGWLWAFPTKRQGMDRQVGIKNWILGVFTSKHSHLMVILHLHELAEAAGRIKMQWASLIQWQDSCEKTGNYTSSILCCKAILKEKKYIERKKDNCRKKGKKQKTPLISSLRKFWDFFGRRLSQYGAKKDPCAQSKVIVRVGSGNSLCTRL